MFSESSEADGLHESEQGRDGNCDGRGALEISRYEAEICVSQSAFCRPPGYDGCGEPLKRNSGCIQADAIRCSDVRTREQIPHSDSTTPWHERPQHGEDRHEVPRQSEEVQHTPM